MLHGHARISNSMYKNEKNGSSSLYRNHLSTRLYYSTRKERDEVEKRSGKNSKELDWEHYEFSVK